MFFKTSEISALENYRLMVCGVTPRPIAWISTQSAAGVNNLAPYSFFTVVSCHPPILMFAQLQPQTGQDKDTLTHLLETKECVVNVVDMAAVQAMNQTCASLPPEQSEFDFAQVESCPSHMVKPLSVAASPVRYECRLREVNRLSSLPMGGTTVLLDVLAVYVKDELSLEGGLIKQPLIDTVGKMGGDWYNNTRELFELKRP